MSFESNYKFWVSTKKDIKHLIKRQDLLKSKDPIEDPQVTYRILSEIYILYAELVKKLGFLYKETLQIQKKDIIRNLIETALLRLIELKNKLKDVELSEYVYLNKSLIARKLTPYDLLIWLSTNFAYSRTSEIKDVLAEHSQIQNVSLKTRNVKYYSEAVFYSINIIQSHERARRARRYKYALDNNNIKPTMDKFKKVLYQFTHKNDMFGLIPIKRTIFGTNFLKTSIKCQKHTKNSEIIKTNDCQYSTEKVSNSALIIQKAWRNYKAKKLLKWEKNNKQSLYGMRKRKKIVCLEEREYQVFKTRQQDLKQKELEKIYAQLMTNERSRLLQEHQSQITEDISDHIRGWLKEFYEKTGDFHPYPDALKSGTVLVLIDETMDIAEFKEYLKTQELSKEEKKNLREQLKLQKIKEKEKIKKEKLKEKKRQRKMAESGIVDIGTELKNNKNVEKIKQIFGQYLTDWKNVDEFLNKHDVIKEFVTENELAILHKELRILVDKFMRIEYDLLKKSWCADKKKKFKSSLKTEVEISNKVSNRKVMKTYDLPSDRTVESLYQELKESEIIENYQSKNFNDYLGDFNILADDFKNEENLTILSPAKADIKMVIQDFLFGMGVFNVDKSKTLCLVGPKGSGKRLLCNIIASEIGALLINLSPEKTFSFSENLEYFTHIVMKVAKAFQPTIIYIQDVHRIFWNKIPKDQVGIKPTLLRESLVKDIIKAIAKDDKIMVVGTSCLPWSADKKFKKVFQNMLLIPESNYGSIFLMWLELLTQNINSSYYEDFILSALAKVFHKYNTGDIINNVKNSLNIERRMRLHHQPVNPNEFLDFFISQSSQTFPLEDKVLTKYKDWYESTNKYNKLKFLKANKNAKKK